LERAAFSRKPGAKVKNNVIQWHKFRVAFLQTAPIFCQKEGRQKDVEKKVKKTRLKLAKSQKPVINLQQVVFVFICLG